MRGETVASVEVRMEEEVLAVVRRKDVELVDLREAVDVEEKKAVEACAVLREEGVGLRIESEEGVAVL